MAEVNTITFKINKSNALNDLQTKSAQRQALIQTAHGETAESFNGLAHTNCGNGLWCSRDVLEKIPDRVSTSRPASVHVN